MLNIKKALISGLIVTGVVVLYYIYYLYVINRIKPMEVFKLSRKLPLIVDATQDKCKRSMTWVKKENADNHSLYKVLQSYSELRKEFNGWPLQLFHDDYKCGTNYPLKSIRVHDIMSQCNSLNIPFSCCNNDLGVCGTGQQYCQCENCIDYKKVIYPEIYEWKSVYEECDTPMPSYIETCSFLQQQFSSVTFIGDSLTRHLFEAFLIHLTNDPVNGAIKSSLPDDVLKECQGDYQFAEEGCRKHIAMDWNTIKNNSKYCAGLSDKIKISFKGMYSANTIKDTLPVVRQLLKEERPLVVFGLGGHNSFDYNLIIKKYLDPIVNEWKEQQNSKAVFVWLNIVAHGYLKYMRYIEIQGNHKIIPYNNALKEYCEKNSIIVFESYDLTKGVHSFDGTHYGQALNIERLKQFLIRLKSSL